MEKEGLWKSLMYLRSKLRSMPKDGVPPLALSVVGVALCFFLSNYMKQLLLVDAQFGPHKNVFPPYNDFLRLTNALAACIVALVAYAASTNCRFVFPVVPLSTYLGIACCTTLATVSEYELGCSWSKGVGLWWKSTAVVAVMGWHHVVVRAKYEGRVWLLGTAFCVACCLAAVPWVLQLPHPDDSWQFGPSSMRRGWAVAAAFSALYLGCVSLAPVLQDQVFRQQGAGVGEQMLFLSAGVAGINLTGFLLGDHGPYVIGFLVDHPSAIQNLCLAAMPSSLGLFLMLWMLRRCGPVVCVMLHGVLLVITVGVQEGMFASPTTVLWWIGLSGMVACFSIILWGIPTHHPHQSHTSGPVLLDKDKEKEMEEGSLVRHTSGSSEDMDEETNLLFPLSNKVVGQV